MEGPWKYTPDPVLLYIFGYLGPRDLCKAGLACRSWWRLSRDDILWKHLFIRDYKIDKCLPIRRESNGWYEEYRRLVSDVPIILSECIDAHTHQVLHVSFSHNGQMFASTSKDGTVMVWNSTYPCSLKYQHDMKSLSWKYTQFSQFNSTDSLLLVSGVYFGSHLSTSGEIAVFSLQNEFSLRCRVNNKPYDLFGCWIGDNHLVSGDLYWLGHLTSSSFLWIDKASQEPESEYTPVIVPLYKFYNPNASSVRSILISECLWPGTDSDESSKIDCSGVSALHHRSLNIPPGSKNQPPILYLPEYRNSIDEAFFSADELSSDSDSESVSASSQEDDLKNKLLIYTTGEETYAPHQIGFKRIENVEFPSRLSPGLSIKERIAARERERERERENAGIEIDYADYDAVKDKFNKPDKLIDLRGHIIGMAVSPDNRYLYVNSRPWPVNFKIQNPLNPPPIASHIDIHVIDLTSITPVGSMTRIHHSYAPNSECFFIFLDVCDKYVASGENCSAYIWDRYYGTCLAYLPHEDCVNAIAFNPVDTHMCITASDDYSIKVWRSRTSAKRLGISGRGQPEGTLLRENI